MKVLVTGAGGQLGHALTSNAPDDVTVSALKRGDVDIADAAAVRELMAAVTPDLVINAAAYTAVDRAETESAEAFAANAQGPQNLAEACVASGARLLHVSTDFVFDGQASRPYAVDAAPAPLGVYGESKLAGEQAVQASGADALILRTGWVYGAHGHNFVKTMLRLHEEREELRVVADQVGTPTRSESLAAALWAAAARPALSGLYHWSDAGVCSWYDFAVAIGEEGSALGLISAAAHVVPVATEDYPTPARRPSYSVLDKSRSWMDFGRQSRHWRSELRDTLRQIKALDSAE